MKLFGIEIDERPRGEILRDIIQRISSSKRTFVVTANALIMLKAKEDKEYRDALKSADLVVPDGTGIVIAARFKGKKIGKYPGVELTKDLINEGMNRDWKFYLLGAREEVVSKLAKALGAKGLNICGYHHGYFEGNGPVEDIASKRPDVVLVAMGVPKQELWIHKNIDKFDKGLFIGVGGTFDVLSGFKKRAPNWMIEAGLEWLYRISQDPRRWRNIFKLMKFFFYAMFDRS